MTVGALTSLVGEAIYESHQIYIKLFSGFSFGQEPFTSPPDSARNLIVGGVAIIAAGTIPFFNGLRKSTEELNNRANQG
jgi:hypothetical protein